LSATLTTRQHDDLCGAVTVNAVDAMLAIASALNRIADAAERNAAVAEHHGAQATEMANRIEAAMSNIALLGDDGGHA
jgi:hypothetical protein